MGKMFKKIIKNSYGNDPLKIFALIHEHVKYKHKNNIEICDELMLSPATYMDIVRILDNRATATSEELDKVKELSSLLTISYGNLINGYKDKTTDIRKMIGKSLTQLAKDDKTEGIIYKLTPIALGTKTRFKYEHFKVLLCDIIRNDGIMDTDITSDNLIPYYCKKSSTIRQIMEKVKDIYFMLFNPETDEAGAREVDPITMLEKMRSPLFFSILAFVCGANSTFLIKERPFKKLFFGISGGDYMVENIKGHLIYMLTTGEITYEDTDLINNVYSILNDNIDGKKIKKVEEKLNINHGWLIGRMKEKREGEKAESIMELYNNIKESEYTQFIY